MISPFISGYNLVENPLIFTTKLLIVFYVTMNIKWMVRTKKWNGIDSTQLLGLRDRTYEQQKNSDSWKLKENWKRFLQTKKLQNDWEAFWIYSVSLWSLLWWLPRLLKSKDKLSRWRGFLNLRIDEYFSIGDINFWLVIGEWWRHISLRTDWLVTFSSTAGFVKTSCKDFISRDLEEWIFETHSSQ